MSSLKIALTRFRAAFFAALLCLPPAALAQEEQTAAAPPPVPAANPLKTQDELRAAYQKEYAFLEAQVRELQARLNEFDRTSRAAEADKEALIDRVEGEYIDLQTRGERINNLLTEAERQINAVEDSRSTLEATFLQAGSTLEPYGIEEIRSEEYLASPDGEKIATLFDHTLELTAGLGKLRSEDGVFFLSDGTEVSGKIVHVGNIASFGVAGEAGGALAPAGDDRFKVWAASSPGAALALANGRAPEVLDIFLYESTTKAIEEREGKTLVGVINSGGTIGWIIVGLGALAALLIVLRVIFLRSASANTGKVDREIGDLVEQKKVKEALQAAKKLKGSAANVVSAALRNLDRDRAHIEDIISEQILHESAHLNRFGAFIIVIAAVAPLLGLLGTVTGMIATFDIITEFGTGDPKLLSSGISIALVTTELGLAVAIPALIFGNLLSGWAETIKDDMEKAALHVINRYKQKPQTETTETGTA
ncbi:MAG: MotA/TolQ/ExbB proton channel family protein [Xanthomonadales bacterium]|jgi:biopolymer transport protein ExbB|nr:MotA/TolQ/ExbB proton channel family protein [Xanthomonadales bacterium]